MVVGSTNIDEPDSSNAITTWTAFLFNNYGNHYTNHEKFASVRIIRFRCQKHALS